MPCDLAHYRTCMASDARQPASPPLSVVSEITESRECEAIRFVATKVGLAVLVLGCWHFFNMQMIARYGRQVGRWVRENHGARPV